MRGLMFLFDALSLAGAGARAEVQRPGHEDEAPGRIAARAPEPPLRMPDPVQLSLVEARPAPVPAAAEQRARFRRARRQARLA